MAVVKEKFYFNLISIAYCVYHSMMILSGSEFSVRFLSSDLKSVTIVIVEENLGIFFKKE